MGRDLDPGRVQGLGFRVYRVWGLGFKVLQAPALGDYRGVSPDCLLGLGGGAVGGFGCLGGGSYMGGLYERYDTFHPISTCKTQGLRFNVLRRSRPHYN